MKKIISAVILLAKDSNEFLFVLLTLFGVFLPDALYLKLQFRLKMGYKLDLDNPRSFNEKIQWLKLYNRKTFYTTLVDKYAVKEHVAKIIGLEHVIPSIGVWKNACDIDFDMLPNQFVLKTTNGGGGDVVICKDKSLFDKNKAIKHLNEGLKKSIYKYMREWPYKNVPPKIIAESYMEDEFGELRDYKFFCFDGLVKCVQVDFGRFSKHRRNLYDLNWNILPFGIQYESIPDIQLPKPENFEKMIDVARTLSKGMPHVRVDLYNVRGKIYFGELTFYHGSGYERFCPSIWDERFGECITLPNKT